MRGINDRFIQDLKTGALKFFGDLSTNNPNICLEIRKNYINLYYKGGNAVRITQKQSGYYFEFDSRYCLSKNDDRNYQYLSNLGKRKINDFVDAFPLILGEMDSFFLHHPKPERIFQHNLIRQNQKDLIIVDIEYAGWTSDKRLIKIDMLGLLETLTGYKLIIIENKFGTGAIGGKAGLKKHYDDFVDILGFPQSRDELIDSVINIVNDKFELGILNFNITRNEIREIEIMFVIAGFNSRSKSISNIVGHFTQTQTAKIVYLNSDETKINYQRAMDFFE